jgi:hypothetical protein
MKFDELCNKLMVENTDSFNSMKEDDDKLRDLDYFSDPQKYENVQKELFKKYFDDIYDNSDWEKMKDVMKNERVENLYDVSQILNRIYKKKFDDLYHKMEKGEEDGTIESKGGSESLANMLSSAWASGLDNAGDTFRDEEHPRHWNVAYDSISQSSPFNENQDVQDWYKANGYNW